MILICPKCAASYAVKKGQIRSDGRTVRCTACGHKWVAHPKDVRPLPLKQADPEPRPQPAPDPPPEPVPDQPVSAESEPPPDEETAPEVDLAIPRPKPTRAPSRRFGPPARLVWAGFAAVLAITALALALLRDHVVRVWPKTAALYAAAGMSVNGVGLLIEDVRLAPAVQNGQAVLASRARFAMSVTIRTLRRPSRSPFMTPKGLSSAGWSQIRSTLSRGWKADTSRSWSAIRRRESPPSL